MASAAELRMQRELLAIRDAGVVLARAELADAEQQRRRSAENAGRAEARALEAYDHWAGCIDSRLLGPGSVRSAADQLLAAESNLVGTRKQHDAAEREAEARSSEYQTAEARRRAASDRVKRAERLRGAKLEERRLDEVNDLLLARKGNS